ncbi:spore coat protein I [Bacillus oleivorans]|uniref:Spore coat protein I n=1 Tax=Bacillus oleivorans TaxID=1448271 RepID=A0A285D2K4_9BACI|nr:CotS family spore coat protein [Bacillus oleivorans]SNX74050.1 spore coat protein I [Bacillus oleivorans]
MEHNMVQDLELGKRLMSENYPDLEVLQMEVFQGGGIKTVWRVETAQGIYGLKRIRKPLPVVESTTAAQVYLAGKGVLVPDIIPTKDGNRYFVHEGYAVVLYSWIDGTDLEMEENKQDLLTGIRGLAQFQKDSVGFVAPEGVNFYNRMGAWPKHYEGMLEEFKQWKEESKNKDTAFYRVYLKIADNIIYMSEKALELLNKSCYSKWVEEIGEHGYLTHQDYGKGNALLTENGVYVLDLDNLAYDIPIRDLRKLIFKRMKETENWNLAEIEEYISCFTSILPLTEEQIKLIYIDLLFPDKFYGYVKKPFRMGEVGDVNKLLKTYKLEANKMPVLKQVLQLD